MLHVGALIEHLNLYYLIFIIVCLSNTIRHPWIAACEIHDLNSNSALTSYLFYSSGQIKEMSHADTFVSGAALAS